MHKVLLEIHKWLFFSQTPEASVAPPPLFFYAVDFSGCSAQNTQWQVLAALPSHSICAHLQCLSSPKESGRQHSESWRASHPQASGVNLGQHRPGLSRQTIHCGRQLPSCKLETFTKSDAVLFEFTPDATIQHYCISILQISPPLGLLREKEGWC